MLLFLPAAAACQFPSVPPPSNARVPASLCCCPCFIDKNLVAPFGRWLKKFGLQRSVSPFSVSFLRGFCPCSLYASPLQPELDYACQLGLVMLMTTRYTEITLINRLSKALPIVSTLQMCNASHVQKDTFSLPTSAKNHITDFSEAKINLGG